ncbi:hypothetical protein I6F35_12770 [Bradyrhizobium sp. BRP22]|uniref:hypothetical protein n=1 Tax=Bradyrhizobium sp. BRP22 TaxID=2793821 RepID=UPI001CD7BE8D|nr:hypothetical protein [Bradyrhizobium sp. BRP22]MCA1454086.1 hypothetical protein [Bradyrhizobium sp. BRP22]
MSQSDPTDNALAAIASILDEQQTPPALEKPQAEPAAVEEQPASPPPLEAHGYSKVGPGPMAALRFKWTVREQDGQYYVDETIGENSKPLVSGPMGREAAINFVDDREADAHRRFEILKQEMSSRAAVASLVREEGGEI